MSKIQRIPQGFLSLFGIISTGATPVEVQQNVQPTLETSDFYLADRVETIQATSAGTSGLDANASVTVPEGQAWRVLGMHALFSNGSGSTAVYMSVGVQTPDSQYTRFAYTQSVNASIIAGRRVAVSSVPGRPFVLTSGMRLQALIEAATAGGVTFDLNFRAVVQVLAR